MRARKAATSWSGSARNRLVGTDTHGRAVRDFDGGRDPDGDQEHAGRNPREPNGASRAAPREAAPARTVQDQLDCDDGCCDDGRAQQQLHEAEPRWSQGAASGADGHRGARRGRACRCSLQPARRRCPHDDRWRRGVPTGGHAVPGEMGLHAGEAPGPVRLAAATASTHGAPSRGWDPARELRRPGPAADVGRASSIGYRGSCKQDGLRRLTRPRSSAS
jgi:hypothetical protein